MPSPIICMNISPDRRREREIDVRWHIASILGLLCTVGFVSTMQRRHQDRRIINVVVDNRAVAGNTESIDSSRSAPRAPITQRAEPSSRRQIVVSPSPSEDTDRARIDLMMQERDNQRQVAAESISPEWVSTVVATVTGPGWLNQRMDTLQRSFLREQGPAIGPHDINYESYCAALLGRGAYPYNAVSPTLASLYTSHIQGWLASGDSAAREAAFVTTAGITMHVGFTVDGRFDIPSALDIAMGRNDSAYLSGSTSPVVEPRYDWVMALLNAKIASQQERDLCLVSHNHGVLRNQAHISLRSALHDVSYHFPLALTHLPLEWWTPARQAAALAELQDARAYSPIPALRDGIAYDTVIAYVNGLALE